MSMHGSNIFAPPGTLSWMRPEVSAIPCGFGSPSTERKSIPAISMKTSSCRLKPYCLKTRCPASIGRGAKSCRRFQKISTASARPLSTCHMPTRPLTRYSASPCLSIWTTISIPSPNGCPGSPFSVSVGPRL